MIPEAEIYQAAPLPLPVAWVLLLALLLDLIIGDPRALYDRLPHPVVWMGGLLSRLDRLGNRTDFSDRSRKISGVLCLTLYLGLIAVAAYWLNRLILSLPSNGLSLLLLAAVASIFLSSRSLINHVKAVASPLETGDVGQARGAVGMIVGRNVDQMTVPAVCRAAIESLAENFSDGVIAPTFWFLIGGLPGLILYKAINTADSMIGHKSPQYRHFGWAAARLDDVMNYIPARLCALLIILSSVFLKAADSIGAARAAFRFAPRHRSPNAGWPEAAMAGALAFRLGGPLAYGSEHQSRSWLGAGRERLSGNDIRQSLQLINICIIVYCVLLFIYGRLVI